MSNERTVFMGRAAFDDLKNLLDIKCECRGTVYRGVNFKLNEMMGARQCVTMDKDIVKLLKDLEKKKKVDL